MHKDYFHCSTLKAMFIVYTWRHQSISPILLNSRFILHYSADSCNISETGKAIPVLVGCEYPNPFSTWHLTSTQFWAFWQFQCTNFCPQQATVDQNNNLRHSFIVLGKNDSIIFETVCQICKIGLVKLMP